MVVKFNLAVSFKTLISWSLNLISCIFVTLSVELDDQRPDLAGELKKGFAGLKSLINRLLDEGKKSGQVREELNTSAITEMVFAGMVGASVIYGVEKSATALDQRIDYLLEVLDGLDPES